MNVTDDVTEFGPGAILWSAIMGILSVVTVVGNIAVLLSYYLDKNIRQPTNYFIFSLAISDLVIGLEGIPVYTYYYLNNNQWNLGWFLCDTWLSIDYIVCLASIYTVLGITVDRYCSVKIPAAYRNWRTPSRIRWVIIIIWAIPSLLFTVTIFGYETISGNKRDYSLCFAPFQSHPYLNMGMYLSYYWSTLFVMLYLYWGIYRAAKALAEKSEQKTKRLAILTDLRRPVAADAHSMRTSDAGRSSDDSHGDTSDSTKCTRNHASHDAHAPPPSLATYPQSPKQSTADCHEHQHQHHNNDTWSRQQHDKNGHAKEDQRTENHAASNNHVVAKTKERKREPPVKVQLLRRSYSIPKAGFGSYGTCEPTPTATVANSNHKGTAAYVNAVYEREQKKEKRKWRHERQGYRRMDDTSPEEIRRQRSSHQEPSSIIERESTAPYVESEPSSSEDEERVHLLPSLPTPPPKSMSVHAFIPPDFHNQTTLMMTSTTSSVSGCSRTTLTPPPLPEEEPAVMDLLQPDRCSPMLRPESAERMEDRLDDRHLKRARAATLAAVPRRHSTHPLQNCDDSDDRRPYSRTESMSKSSVPVIAVSHVESVRSKEGRVTRMLTALKSRSGRKKGGGSKKDVYKSRSENRARKALRTITVILGTFTVLWTPFYVFATIYGFCGSACDENKTFQTLFSISYYLCYMNSPINPFCYAMANQQFKRALLRIFRGDFRRV